MIYIYQILMILFIVFSAKHQGRAHLGIVRLTQKERDKWHAEGLILYCLMCAIPVYQAWPLLFPAFIIRVALFDIFYNRTAGLKYSYIGDGKEFFERLAIKIFGNEGGITKAIVFMILLVGLNILNYYLFKIKI